MQAYASLVCFVRFGVCLVFVSMLMYVLDPEANWVSHAFLSLLIPDVLITSNAFAVILFDRLQLEMLRMQSQCREFLLGVS